MTGAGLKKWMPQTLSGRPVCMAISMTGSVEVLVARMAWSSVMRSRSPNSCFFTSRSSTTDSMTRSQACRASRSELPVTRPSAWSRSSSVFLPFSTCRFSDFSRAASVASAVDWLRDRSTTSKPLTAAVSAMPDPMIPDPTIPTRAIDIGGDASGGVTGAPNRRDGSSEGRPYRTGRGDPIGRPDHPGSPSRETLRSGGRRQSAVRTKYV